MLTPMYFVDSRPSSRTRIAYIVGLACRFSFVRDMDDLTFIEVKFHEPVILPCQEALQIFLVVRCLLQVVNRSLHYAVFSKQSCQGRIYTSLVVLTNCFTKDLSTIQTLVFTKSGKQEQNGVLLTVHVLLEICCSQCITTCCVRLSKCGDYTSYSIMYLVHASLCLSCNLPLLIHFGIGLR